MDYYRQITQSVDPDSWQKIVAQPGDQSIAIGAASGPAYFTTIADRTSNQYDTSFLVDGRITQAVVDGLINSPHSNTALANDTLTSGFGHELDHFDYYGGQGNDILTGGGSNELFLGGPGNDTIRGGGGADTLDGGTGADNFIYSKYASPVVTFDASSGKYSFDGGTAEVITSGSFDVSGLQGDRITFAAPTMSGDQPFSPMPTPSNGQVGDDQYFLERGTFNTVNGSAAFTRNGSGADTLVVYDSNDALSTAVGNGAFVIQGVIPGNLSATQLSTGERVIYYAPDTTAPTLTITDATLGTATGPVVYGFNFSEPVTGFTADDVVTAGVKAQLIQTDATHYTMTVIPPTGSGTMQVGVNAGAVTDLAGNPNTLAISDPQAYAPAPATGPYVPGQASIDLADYGKLMAPVNVDGKWYYVWDMNGDEVHNNSLDSTGKFDADGSLANSSGTGYQYDYINRGVLDSIFRFAEDFVSQGGSGSNNIYRFAQLSGVKLALPTIGSGQSNVNYVERLYGTAIDNTPAGEENPFYDDLLAIWDAFNGPATMQDLVGTPTNWYSTTYASATPSAYGHASFALSSGFLNNGYGNGYVAVQVLPPDTTAPTFTSAATATFAENTPSTTTVYDATADGDVGVSYTLIGTDAALFNIAAATGLVTFKASPNFEAPTDAGANNVYDFTVTATDASSNATSQAVQLTVTDVAESTSLAGQAVIDLGSNGKLIAPVQVEGNWYYYWDRSGDGTSANRGNGTVALNGGVDYATHDELDGIFKYASDFTTINPTYAVGNAAADDTTDTYRFATINGVNLALPTANGGVGYPQGMDVYKNGTAYTDAGASTNGTSSSFNDLLAVWDAYNGSGTGANINGTPAGWTAYRYGSATPAASLHAHVNLSSGYVSAAYENGNLSVALQVL